MKKMLIVLGLVLTSATAVMAADMIGESSMTSDQWFCSGMGTINMGGPGGSISMPVSGHGKTEFEAMSNAQQNCHSQGLQMCMISNCSKK